MDLFLPVGFDAKLGAISASVSNVRSGYVQTTLRKTRILNLWTLEAENYEIPPPDGERTDIPGARANTTSFYSPTVPLASAALTFRKTPSLHLDVYFGKTTYTFGERLPGIYTQYAPPYFTNTPSVAFFDGVLELELQDAEGKTIAKNQAAIAKYAFKTSISLFNIDDGEEGDSVGFLVWRYISNQKNIFEECQFVPSSNSWPIKLLSANHALIAKINYQSSGEIGPQALAKATANLGFTESINLLGGAAVSAFSFCNAEIDSQLNLRALATVAATATSTLLGPIDLSAQADCSCTATASSAMTVALVANTAQQVSARAFPRIGSVIFLQAEATATAAIAVGQSLLVSSRVSGMTAYVNLETREFVVSPVLVAPVSSMNFTRRDIEAIDIKFVRDGRVQQLSYGSFGKLGIKSEFDGAVLALDSAWQEKGQGEDATYQFSLNLNTEELNDLFVTDDEKSISAKVELEWSEGGTINTTLPVTAIVYNDVLRGDEGVPTVAAANSFKLLSPDNSLWTIAIANDGTLSATK